MRLKAPQYCRLTLSFCMIVFGRVQGEHEKSAPFSMSINLPTIANYKTEIVCTCIVASRELSELHESLNRLLLASSSCPSFTVSQRIDILDSARQALNAVSVQY